MGLWFENTRRPETVTTISGRVLGEIFNDLEQSWFGMVCKILFHNCFSFVFLLSSLHSTDTVIDGHALARRVPYKQPVSLLQDPYGGEDQSFKINVELFGKRKVPRDIKVQKIEVRSFLQ